MELQFAAENINCLKQIKGEQQTQEQTQELRLTDGMPDVGRVLCTWGQPVLRGKEWQSDSVGINCGVMIWVLYAPEDGSQAQCVQSWLPMNFRWDIPQTNQDGTVNCHLSLRSVDSRPVSGRKLMLRATVCAAMQAYVPWDLQVYRPENIPADVQIKKTEYPLCLVKEAGEKAFTLDEELTLPDSVPALDKVLRFCLQPEIEERKVLGDKLVFRGNAHLHLLYRTQEGAMSSWDQEIPFSQYTQLNQEYGSGAQMWLLPAVTSAEAEADDQGRLRLKAGLSGQYVVYDTVSVPVVEDAYSPDREITQVVKTMELPTVLERQSQRVRAEQTGNFGSSRVVDTVFYVGCPHKQRRTEELSVELPGQFQVLYYDTEGALQAASVGWQDTVSMGLGSNASMDILCSSGAYPQAVTGENTTILRGEILMDTVTTAVEEMPAVTALTLGEARQKDPTRPSLILRRAGKSSLWEMAKANGSTVEAIRQANALQQDPDPDKILLIPVM